MANRRISEFPAINGTDIAEADLLTLVHVFEVDPVLRNKKITFNEFRNYLDQYYINLSGDVVLGDLTVTGNFEVYNNTKLFTLETSGLSTLSGVIVQNNLIASGTVSGSIFSGISGIFVDQLSGATVTGNTGQFSNLTSVSGIFTSQLSGATVTGGNANFTSGTFQHLTAGSHTTTGNHTISGDLFVSGSGFFASGISVTGTVSGQTVTGTSAQFPSHDRYRL